jgi:hypothetical protein
MFSLVCVHPGLLSALFCQICPVLGRCTSGLIFLEVKLLGVLAIDLANNNNNNNNDNDNADERRTAVLSRVHV